jgi:hypothetical protein
MRVIDYIKTIPSPNNRVYPPDVIEKIYEKLKEFAARQPFQMEVRHNTKEGQLEADVFASDALMFIPNMNYVNIDPELLKENPKLTFIVLKSRDLQNDSQRTSQERETST